MIKRWPLKRKRGGHARRRNRISSRPHPAERVGLYSLVSRRVITPLSDTTLGRSACDPFISSPLPQRCLVGKQTDGGATISQPQKRLRINVPLLLPSLLRAFRRITPPLNPPGADYNYRAFCFAILSPFPAGRGRKIKFRLFSNLLPCVEFGEKTPHLPSSVIVNHHSEAS